MRFQCFVQYILKIICAPWKVRYCIVNKKSVFKEQRNILNKIVKSYDSPTRLIKIKMQITIYMVGNKLRFGPMVMPENERKLFFYNSQVK